MEGLWAVAGRRRGWVGAEDMLRAIEVVYRVGGDRSGRYLGERQTPQTYNFPM